MMFWCDSECELVKTISSLSLGASIEHLSLANGAGHAVVLKEVESF